MEHATYNISFFCRNARLSLQKATFSRRSHMLSEELEHLRNFENLVSETLPQHPLYSAKRGEKEILELEFYLPDVKKRLAELEGQHPFLYKHHHKRGNRANGSNSKSKRVKESPETALAQKRKLLSSSPQTLSRPPSSSSSSSRKGLSASTSDFAKTTLPMPNKHSHGSRSPSLRSNSSGSIGLRKSKRSMTRSPLDRYVDDAVLPLEELKLPSDSTMCRDSFDNDLRFSSHKPKVTLDNANHRPKYVDDFRIPSTKLKLGSDDGKFKVNLEKYVDGDFSSHKSKLTLFDSGTRCKSSLDNYIDGLGFPSPKAPTKPSVNDYSRWIVNGSDTGEDTGKTLMEGFVVNSDGSEDAEYLLDSMSFYDDLSRQRLRNFTGEVLPQGHGPHEKLSLYEDDSPLLHLTSERSQPMRPSSRGSQKRSHHSSSNGVGKQGKDAAEAMWSSFQELESAIEDFDCRKDGRSTIRDSVGELERNKLETKRALAGLALTENLEEALKRLGSLQESDGSAEEPETFRNEEKSLPRQAYSLETRSRVEPSERMAADAEELSFTGKGSRRALFGNDGSAEARRVSFQDDWVWAENGGRLEASEDDGPDSKLEMHRKLGLAKDWTLGEKSWQELNIWEDKTSHQEECIATEDIDKIYEVSKGISQFGDMEASSMKAEEEKSVKYGNWAADAKLEGSIAPNKSSFVEQTQPEAGDRSLSSRHSRSGTGDAVSRLEKLQVKHFIVKENFSRHSDGEDVEGMVHSKPTFTQSHLSSLSHDALSSSFSSSASCGAIPSLHYSESFRNVSCLGRLSPPWDSSFNTTSLNILADEDDARLYQHQRGASKPQQLTFCNPVFDFDSTLSSKAYSESNSRPMLDPCDADEERLKSILGDCSYVASQLNNSGASGRGSLGMDNGSDGSMDDIHNGSKLPFPVAQARFNDNKHPHQIDVCGRPSDEKDALQVSELAMRMDSFQTMLNELKETLQNSSLHVRERVDICEANVKGMERQLDAFKMETNSELLGLRRFIKSELDTRVEKGGSRKELHNDGSSEGKMKRGLDECYSKTLDLQRQIESWLSKMHIELRNHIEDTVSCSVGKLESSLKRDIEKLELQGLRDVGNLKKEMGLKLSLHESKEQLNKKSEEQLDVVVEHVLAKQLPHLIETVSAKNEDELEQIKAKLSYLRKETEACSKGRAEVQDYTEGMTRQFDEMKAQLDKQDLKSFKDTLTKQLQLIRNEEQQVKYLVDAMKKEKDEQVHDVRLSVDKLKVEALECREGILGLRNLERLLSEEQVSLKKAIEELQKSKQEEFDREILKQLKVDFEKWRSSESAEREGTLIMERVESLSQLYLGGLGEVRAELKDLKLHFQVKLDALERQHAPIQQGESSTKVAFLNDLETRILELEKEHNCTRALEEKAEDILAIVGKHRKLASAAATDAAASAHKAEESLAELLSFISSEMNNMKNKSSKLQESLTSDRENSSSLLLEMMNISADLRKEKETALAAASAAKKHIQEVEQSCENELAKVRLGQSKVEKDKDWLRSLAQEMAGSAAKAKDVLQEMMEVRQRSVELSDDVLSELTQTKRKSLELAEEVVGEFVNIKQKTKELSQEVVDEMANAKRKSVELGQDVLGEITNTRRAGLQLQESAAKELSALQSKAEDLLAGITRAKKKALQIQEDAAAEAASWASRAEDLIGEITTASNETTQCKEAAIAEAATLANKAEEVLAEMLSLRRKSSQIHENMSEAIKNAVQLVQEQCDSETHGWKKVIESEMRKAKAFGDEIEKIRSSTSIPLSTESLVSKNNFTQHLAKVDARFKELTDSVNGLNQSIDALKKINGGDQEPIKQDVIHLKKRVETIASMLEAMFHLSARPGELKLQDLLPELQAERCSISELEKRIVSIEGSQIDGSSKIGELLSKNEELDKSVAIWLSKYDAAARVLSEVESRLTVLENSSRNDVKSEKRVDEKEPFLSFYKDIASGRDTDDGRWPPLEAERTMDARDKGVVKSLDARIIILESRIEHVASATYTNLRILDTKVEHINGSLETALESATMAEKKCKLLGAELVKVFRLLANTDKVSPEKPRLSTKGGESCFRSRFSKPETPPWTRRDPHVSARMNPKKHGPPREEAKLFRIGSLKLSEQNGQAGTSSEDKGKVKANNDPLGNSPSSSFHARSSPSAPNKDLQRGSKKAFSVLRCNFDTFESDDDDQESDSIQQSKVVNDKQGHRAKEPHKKDNHEEGSSPAKTSQTTDFRINSGSVRVNVSHKSRLFK